MDKPRSLGFFLLAAVIVVADQLTKYWVLATDRFNAMQCLELRYGCGKIELSSVFDLTMVWNRGMSFGAFQSEGMMRWVLFSVQGAIAIGFAYWLSRAERWLTRLSLGMVIGGAIGNMIDRARFGAVVDFFDFSGLFFPYVFNVADAAISVGAALLFLDQFLISRNAQKTGKPG